MQPHPCLHFPFLFIYFWACILPSHKVGHCLFTPHTLATDPLPSQQCSALTPACALTTALGQCNALVTACATAVGIKSDALASACALTTDPLAAPKLLTEQQEKPGMGLVCRSARRPAEEAVCREHTVTQRQQETGKSSCTGDAMALCTGQAASRKGLACPRERASLQPRPSEATIVAALSSFAQPEGRSRLQGFLQECSRVTQGQHSPSPNSGEL